MTFPDKFGHLPIVTRLYNNVYGLTIPRMDPTNNDGGDPFSLVGLFLSMGYLIFLDRRLYLLMPREGNDREFDAFTWGERDGDPRICRLMGGTWTYVPSHPTAIRRIPIRLLHAHTPFGTLLGKGDQLPVWEGQDLIGYISAQGPEAPGGFHSEFLSFHRAPEPIRPDADGHEFISRNLDVPIFAHGDRKCGYLTYLDPGDREGSGIHSVECCFLDRKHVHRSLIGGSTQAEDPDSECLKLFCECTDFPLAYQRSTGGDNFLYRLL